MSKSQVSLTVEQQTLETIASGSSTISKVMFNEAFTRIGFMIDGIVGQTMSSSTTWTDFEFFAPALRGACRTKKGKQFNLNDEHLLHLVGQPVAWNASRSALLKKGDKFESGALVTSDEYLVIKQFHLIPTTIELRKVFKKYAEGRLVMDFLSETKSIDQEANEFLAKDKVVKPKRKRKAPAKAKTTAK